jgi:ribonuclease D
MKHESERRLMDEAEVLAVLRLGREDLITLTNTGQLLPVRICGQTRYASADVSHLIDTYHQIAKRKHDHGQ